MLPTKIRIKIFFDNEISMIFSYHCYSVAKILRLGIEKDSCSFCLTVSVIFHHNIGYIDVILCYLAFSLLYFDFTISYELRVSS